MNGARVVLCADDYGLAPGIGRSIRDLLARGRLSAVSCMTVGPFWREEAARLRDAASGAQVGLHLALTDQAPLGAMPRTAPGGRLPPFGALLRAAYSRRIDGGEVRDEMARQLDAFVSAFGREPDFVDGHHHAQQLPVIRGLVTEMARDRLGGRAWVRTCAEPVAAILRRGTERARSVAFAWPGRALRRRLVSAGLPTNDGYSGAYDFRGRVPYASLFDRFLVGARDGMLVNCHPGFADEALAARDRLTAQREVEHAFFSGPSFPETLARRGVTLARRGDR